MFPQEVVAFFTSYVSSKLVAFFTSTTTTKSQWVSLHALTSISVSKFDLNLDLDFSFQGRSQSRSRFQFCVGFDLSFDFSFQLRSQFRFQFLRSISISASSFDFTWSRLRVRFLGPLRVLVKWKFPFFLTKDIFTIFVLLCLGSSHNFHFHQPFILANRLQFYSTQMSFILYTKNRRLHLVPLASPLYKSQFRNNIK